MRDRKDRRNNTENFPSAWKQNIWFRWPGQLLAVLCAIALTAGAVHLIDRPEHSAGQSGAAVPSAAQQFTDAANIAFNDSGSATSLALTAQQRAAGLPDDPVAGLTSPTPAGPVQLVLPTGLGPAEHTSGGQVVYPNAGAGFDFLAENTATGTRTVARVKDPSGVRVVTTFVRTPADTVMLAHTNGYLTLNRATPTAETIGMFSPAETRDSAGRLVPSSYVVRQIRPQLYQLSEVIDPKPGTVWPVYVDPPLHLAGAGGAPLPQFSFTDVTGAISGAASAVSGAVATAASATVSGAKAVGSFVKENPLESAMLVGGVALALTGVGGPAGAAAIAAATVNLSSAGLDIAVAAMPDNELLGTIATGVGAMSMLTPQGAGKKLVEEGVKAVGEQVAKHADDIVDVAKAAPTPPTQLAGEVSAGAAKPGAAPEISNAATSMPRAKMPPKAPKEFIEPTNPAQHPPSESELPRGFTLREMPPTAQYPHGYFKVHNQHGQAVDPSTMKPPSNVTRAEGRARTHVAKPAPSSTPERAPDNSGSAARVDSPSARDGVPNERPNESLQKQTQAARPRSVETSRADTSRGSGKAKDRAKKGKKGKNTGKPGKNKKSKKNKKKNKKAKKDTKPKKG